MVNFLFGFKRLMNSIKPAVSAMPEFLKQRRIKRKSPCCFCEILLPHLMHWLRERISIFAKIFFFSI